MTTYIADKDGKSIETSKATSIPDRHFRNAWTLSGTVISEDITCLLYTSDAADEE